MPATNKSSTRLYVAEQPSLRLWVNAPTVVKSQTSPPLRNNNKQARPPRLYVAVR